MMDKDYISMKLPCDYEEMESFLIKNKTQCTEQVVSSVNFAIENKLSSVEVFNFTNSEFVVMIEKISYLENLQNIYDYYIQSELYEFCDRVNKLIKRIQNNEKIKKERHQSKSSSKRKTKG